MGYRVKQRVVGVIADAHSQWARDRDHALQTRQEASAGFGAAGMRLLTEIFIEDLSRGTEEAVACIVRETQPRTVGRAEAQEALHSALDIHFAGPQNHVLASNPLIEAALLRAHRRIRDCSNERAGGRLSWCRAWWDRKRSASTGDRSPDTARGVSHR